MPLKQPVEIVWSVLAVERLREIQTYVGRDKPIAAERLVARMTALVEVLRTFPYTGRIGAEPGLRELVLAGTPYIVLYRVRRNRVLIDTIWHGSQKRR